MSIWDIDWGHVANVGGMAFIAILFSGLSIATLFTKLFLLDLLFVPLSIVIWVNTLAMEQTYR